MKASCTNLGWGIYCKYLFIFMENGQRKTVKKYLRVGIIIGIIIYLLLFLINYICDVLINTPIFVLRYVVIDLTVIIVVSSFCLYFIKEKNKIFNAIRRYLKIECPIDLFINFSYGCVISIVFLYFSITNIDFFLTLSSVTFAISGFSFTAGSFFKDNLEFRKSFFTISILYAIIGFLSLFFYMFYEILTQAKNEEIIIFHYFFNVLKVNTLDVIVITTFIFLIVLGFLFFCAFVNLMSLLTKIPKIENSSKD